MSLELRKLVATSEEIHVEGGKACEVPLRLYGVAAVITNPWAGQGFVEDLRPTILAVAPELGAVMVPRLVEMAGGGEAVEAYGKAAMVGSNGEVEHGSGMIHTLRFGNVFRDAVGGYLVSVVHQHSGRSGSDLVDPDDAQNRPWLAFSLPHLGNDRCRRARSRRDSRGDWGIGWGPPASPNR